MKNSYKENGRTWYNYMDADDVCTSFSEKQTNKTPCSAKDTDKTKEEIDKQSKSTKTGSQILDIWNLGKEVADEKQKQTPSSKKDTFKMPTWGWITIGIGSLAALSLVIVLGVKAASKNK